MVHYMKASGYDSPFMTILIHIKRTGTFYLHKPDLKLRDLLDIINIYFILKCGTLYWKLTRK